VGRARAVRCSSGGGIVKRQYPRDLLIELGRMQRASLGEITDVVDRALAMIPAHDERETLDALMTPAEHRAIDMTADLYNLLCAEVVGHGRSRGGDVAELAADIHRIQERIIAQAGARAFPDRYRVLGGEVLRACPSGCGCVKESDPDARECACDGPCTMDPRWPNP
jgi:hypothetical protein